MTTKPLYKIIAAQQQRLMAMTERDTPRADTILLALQAFVKKHMPSGSGIDCGTKFEWVEHPEDKLAFSLSYHHMDGNGFYDGWTEHIVRVYPSLTNEFYLRITGKDRNGIKDYLYNIYSYALRQEVEDPGIIEKDYLPAPMPTS